MNDWIYQYMAAFWLTCITTGTLAGGVILSGDLGIIGGLGAGFVGGAGAALILSISRYIGAGHEEDDAPVVPGD